MKKNEHFGFARRIPRPDQASNSKKASRAQPHHSDPLSGRGSGLFLALLPVFFVPATLFKFFTFRLDQALVLLLAMLGLGAAAVLVRQGQAYHASYDASAMARAAPWPRKGLGFVLIVLAVGGALLGASPMSFGLAIVFASLAGCAAFFAYGLDPLRDKEPAQSDVPQSDKEQRASNKRVWQHIEEAEAKIAALEHTAQALSRQGPIFAQQDTRPPLAPQVAAVADKMTSIAALSSRIVDLVRQDPSDLNQARRFFVTYLDQVSQVSAKFHSYAEQAKDPQQFQRLADLTGAYSRVLTTIETVCHEQIERLQAHDLMDLEVQIEVLQTQLDREGLV